MKLKYIMLGNVTPAAIVFSDVISHAEVACGRHVSSAGFCYIDEEKGAQCFGESISLKIKSNPDRDAERIDSQFRIGEFKYI
jgi:hypothetical protein